MENMLENKMGKLSNPQTFFMEFPTNQIFLLSSNYPDCWLKTFSSKKTCSILIWLETRMSWEKVELKA